MTSCSHKADGGYKYTSKKPFASGSPMGNVMVTSGRYDRSPWPRSMSRRGRRYATGSTRKSGMLVDGQMG